MLKKCANPECLRPFHYLRDGRLIVVRPHGAASHGHPLEYFWLCGACAPHYEVAHVGEGRLALRRSSLGRAEHPPASAHPPLVA
jgi:hypothetical protein